MSREYVLSTKTLLSKWEYLCSRDTLLLDNIIEFAHWVEDMTHGIKPENMLPPDARLLWAPKDAEEKYVPYTVSDNPGCGLGTGIWIVMKELTDIGHNIEWFKDNRRWWRIP